MKLKEFKINAGGKFNPDAPIVIDFTKSKMVGATGDQETGKTTLIDLFLMACGQLGGEKVIDAIKNKETDKLDLELKFVGNDKADYEVSVTKSRLQVKRDGEVKGSPKDLLKTMLGVVGRSPMEIKNAPIEEIVKWLASYSTRSAEEFEKEMTKYKNGIKASRKARAEANKSAKGLREYLAGEMLVGKDGQLIESAWKKNEELYKKEVDIADLSKKLTAAGNKVDKFIENETKVDGQKSRKAQIEAQIAALQKELTQVDENISLGEKWLETNKTAKKDYDSIKKTYDSAAQDVADYNKWQEIKKKKVQMDEFEDVALKADASEKSFLKKQQELQWEVIPDIKGVTIELEDSHEDEGEQIKAGFYYNGFNSRQLSESQWLGLVFKILLKNKVKIVVIDNLLNLGSKFMEVLNDLKEKGCYILYTEMSRGQQTLEIEYQ